MYYWFSTFTPDKITTTPPIESLNIEDDEEKEAVNTQAETKQTVSTSDEIIDIESDLNTTDSNSFDADLNTLDAELEAAMQ